MSTRNSPVCLKGLVGMFRVYLTAGDNHFHRRFYRRFSVSDQYFRRNNLRGIGPMDSGKIGANMHFRADLNTKNNDKYRGDDDDSPARSPRPWFNFPRWGRMVFGTFLSILLPFWSQKGQKLKRIKDEAEMIVEGAEIAAEVVENVAKTAEKVAADVAEKLPEHSKLKEAALLMEHISQVAEHDAQVTINLLHKVDEIKQDWDDLEAMVEPVVDKIVGDNQEKQTLKIHKPSSSS